MQTVALVGASEFNAEAFNFMNAEHHFDYVIAVDGGLAHVQELGITPNLVMGDFDSLGYVPKGLHVLQFPTDKDKSDMELAFERAKTLRAKTVFVFGGLGQRLDHTNSNLQLFARFSETGMLVTAFGMNEVIMLVTGPNSLEIPAQESGIVSVFAMNDICEGVFERGLKWELDGVALTNRTSLGLSNEFIGQAAQIGLSRGTLAIILPL